MRYGMLGLYSAVLQAVGAILALGALVVGGIVIALALGSLTPLSPLVVPLALLGMLAGCIHGLGAIAFGQLLGLAIDVEHNTRLAIRTPELDRIRALDRGYGDD